MSRNLGRERSPPDRVCDSNGSSKGLSRIAVLEDYVAAWRPAVRDHLPDDVSKVAIRFWRSTPGREFHKNRFLSTEIACVQIGKGFDIPDKPEHRKPDLMTLLDNKRRARWKASLTVTGSSPRSHCVEPPAFKLQISLHQPGFKSG